MTKRLIPLIGYVVLLLTVLPAFGQDQPSLQTARWTAPRLLGDGWWQSMALDIEGNLHVAWYGGATSSENKVLDFLEYTVREVDGKWSSPNDVVYTGEGGFTVRNAIAVTSDGILHAGLRKGVDLFFTSSSVFDAQTGANWSRPSLVAASAYYMDMKADSNDVLHMVYSALSGLGEDSGGLEANPCAFCSDLWYRRSTDDGESWSDPVPVSAEENSGSDKPRFTSGFSGRLYLTWDEGYDWYAGRGLPQDVRIIYSDDGGTSWSVPIKLTGGDLTDRRPIQGVSTEMRDGSLMAVWRYSTDTDRNIYYQISIDTGKTWTKPQAIPGMVARSINDTPLDKYELVTDKLGTVHLFAIGHLNEGSTANPALYDLSFQPVSGVWGVPQRVFYSSQMQPEWPRVVIGPQNDLHLTYFIRGIRENFQGPQSSTAILKVYYSYLPGVLQPQATLAFKPTQTPLPTATVFLKLDPTSTPFPRYEGNSDSVAVVSRDTYAAQTFLGGTVLATIFCGLIAAIIRWRRGG